MARHHITSRQAAVAGARRLAAVGTGQGVGRRRSLGGMGQEAKGQTPGAGFLV